MSIVRPFPARVVHQDWVRRAVTAMSDSLDETDTDPVRVAIDPAAYEESAAALYVYRQRRDGASHTGVVCEVAMQGFVDGRVRGHEAVHPRRVEALVGDDAYRFLAREHVLQFDWADVARQTAAVYDELRGARV